MIINFAAEMTHNFEHCPVPFDDKRLEALGNRKSRIAYFYEAVVTCSEPNRQPVAKAIDALQKEGHEVIPFDTSILSESTRIFLTLLFSTKSILGSIGDEKLLEEYKLFSQATSIPQWLKPILVYVFDKLGKNRENLYLKYINRKSLTNFLDHNDLRNEMISAYRDWMTENKIDAVISPAFPFPAPCHGKAAKINSGGQYLLLHNILDCPAGVIPNVHKITEEEANSDYECQFFTPHRDSMTEAIKANLRGSAGMTTGLNIAGLPTEDEEVLGCMKIIEDCLAKHYPPEKMELDPALKTYS